MRRLPSSPLSVGPHCGVDQDSQATSADNASATIVRLKPYGNDSRLAPGAVLCL